MEVATKEIEFKKYSEYKDSGTEYLGEVPYNWEIAKLGAIVEPKSDKGHPDFEVLSVYRDYGVIPKDSRDDNHNATSLDTSNYKAVYPGDLVINKMKAWQGSMGISNHKGIVSPAYITCKVRSGNYESDYLHYLLRCQSYIGEYNRLSYGVRVGQWDMHYEDLKKVTVLLPSPEEQTAIAKFLDEKTAKIDEAISIKQRQIELLKERRQILIHKAVTQGLNPDVPLKPSGVDWIGDIPEHWDVKKIKHCASKISKGTTPSTEGRFILNEGAVRFIKAENIQDGVITNHPKHFIDDKTNEIIGRSKLGINDILFVIAGATLGKVAIVSESILPANTNQAVSFIRPNREANPNYLVYWLTSNFITKSIWLDAVQSAQPNLSMEDLGNLPFISPPKIEQQEILKYLDIELVKLDNSISLQQTQIAKLKEYKTTLINSTVTGKIKVV